MIISPQAAPLGAAAAAAELTRLFPGRKSPGVAVWRSLWREFPRFVFCQIIFALTLKFLV